MELISVIVPVFEVEKYLRECIESILNQTYTNLEIILVDDGSPDKCGEICEEYAKTDNRIIVIHQENKGLSSARNRGLDIATGDYIGFVDSDDKIAPDMFEILLNNLKQYDADISICGFYRLYEDGRCIKEKQSVQGVRLLDRDEALLHLLEDKDMHSHVWNKLFKHDFWKDVRFPVGRNLEDVATTYLLFDNAEKIVTCDTPLYYYVQRPDSIIRTRNCRLEWDRFCAYRERLAYFGHRNEKYRNSMLYFISIFVPLGYNMYLRKKVKTDEDTSRMKEMRAFLIDLWPEIRKKKIATAKIRFEYWLIIRPAYDRFYRIYQSIKNKR